MTFKPRQLTSLKLCDRLVFTQTQKPLNSIPIFPCYAL